MSKTLIYIFSLLLFSCNSNPLDNTYWVSTDPGFHFSLKLQGSKESVYGGYCGYPQDQSRIDCGVEQNQTCSIIGSPFKKNTYILTFESCYSGKKGEAEIRLASGTMYWKVTKYPTGNDWVGVPHETILVKN